MTNQEEPFFMLLHPSIDREELLHNLAEDFAKAHQRNIDAQLNELFDSFRDPGKYHRCRTTYRGIGAKKRLLMKAGLV